ncbi:hypothetical protein AMECASPLE_037006 [Ameca splendens]|uniref:Uncharacterized protein n=1 Tax=Ameca splendens TaxID=208324 RepID=A0ABV0YVL0_9TELE
MKPIKELLLLLPFYFFSHRILLKCFLYESSVFPDPQGHDISRQMAAFSGSAAGFFLLKESFPFHCPYMQAQYEGLLQSQQHNASESPLLLHAHPGGVNADSMQSAGFH